MKELNHLQLLPYDYNYQQWDELLNTWEEPKYRLEQIWHGLYVNLWHFPIIDNKEWTNIPIQLRERINNHFSIHNLFVTQLIHSKDRKTSKALFSSVDNLPIEAVLMQNGKDYGKLSSYTLCLSSQSGCALNCRFCATGLMGFQRNLTCNEIIEQVIYFSHYLQEKGGRISHVVYMGMGEPFLNYDEVIKSIAIFTHPTGLNLGQRKITISTVGIIPGIKQFIDLDTQVNLAISLHAANDELRTSLIPINQKYPLKEIVDICLEYCSKTKRRITFEWALIDNINDTPTQAKQLCQLIKGLLCHVNLIVFNPSPHCNYHPSNRVKVEEFQSILLQHKIPCTIRGKWGIDIYAGCGQLAAYKKIPPKNPL